MQRGRERFHQRALAAGEDEDVFRFLLEAVEHKVFAQEFRLVRELVGGEVEFLGEMAEAAFRDEGEFRRRALGGDEVAEKIAGNVARRC